MLCLLVNKIINMGDDEMTVSLRIEQLKAAVEGKEILKGLNLTVNGGEIHVVKGPNGTGKSTLASALMGHPQYEVTGGRVTLNGEDLLEMVDCQHKAGDG